MRAKNVHVPSPLQRSFPLFHVQCLSPPLPSPFSFSSRPLRLAPTAPPLLSLLRPFAAARNAPLLLPPGRGRPSPLRKHMSLSLSLSLSRCPDGVPPPRGRPTAPCLLPGASASSLAAPCTALRRKSAAGAKAAAGSVVESTFVPFSFFVPCRFFFAPSRSPSLWLCTLNYTAAFSARPLSLSLSFSFSLPLSSLGHALFSLGQNFLRPFLPSSRGRVSHGPGARKLAPESPPLLCPP